MVAQADLSADDLAFALEMAAATLDGMHDDEVEDLFGGLLTPEEVNARAARIRAAYSTVREV